MFAPAGAPVLTLRIAVNQIILMIGPGDVPHFPFAVVIEEIGFVNASVLPVFVGDERWFWLVDPLLTVPLQIADRVWSPKVLGGTRIVDSLYRCRTLWVPPST